MNTESQTSSGGDTTEAPRDLRLPGALVRTALSSEQTLMSWVRTSLSMVTFGFSIAQFFYFLAERQDDADFTASPNRLGIALIGVGMLVLVLAMVEHLLRIRTLKSQGLPGDAGSFLPMGSAAALFAIAIIALISLFLGWRI
jgi:putative membrane protein